MGKFSFVMAHLSVQKIGISLLAVVFLAFGLFFWGEGTQKKANILATNAIITSSCGAEVKLGQSCTLKATKDNTDITTSVSFMFSGNPVGKISGNIFTAESVGTTSIFAQDASFNTSGVLGITVTENQFLMAASCGNMLEIAKECVLTATKDGKEITTQVQFEILGNNETQDPIAIALGLVPVSTKLASIKGNVLTAENEGTITVQAKENGKISNTISITLLPVSAPSLYFVKTLGNNRIFYNTTENFEVRIMSPSPLSKVQNLEILMVKGHIETEKDEIYIPKQEDTAFVLKEYQDASPVKEQIAAAAGKNYGLLQIPVLIPEYDPVRDMSEGEYTFFVTLYDGYKKISQKKYFLFLGENALFCDINGDGKQSIVDGILALKFANKSIVPTDAEKKRADKNKNDAIDIVDVLQILRCVNGQLK